MYFNKQLISKERKISPEKRGKFLEAKQGCMQARAKTEVNRGSYSVERIEWSRCAGKAQNPSEKDQELKMEKLVKQSVP